MEIPKVLIMIIFLVVGFLLGVLFVEFGLFNFGLTGQVVLDTPNDFIDGKNIFAYPDKIVIFVDNATVANYASTGSMAPFLGSSANGIKLKPSSIDEINVGDIISFEENDGINVVHRVVEKGFDSEGIYFITRGDSNLFNDKKIRFEDVDAVLVGIIY